MSVSFLFMTEYNRISLSEVPLDLSHNCGKKKKKRVEDIFEQNDTSDLRKNCSSIKKKKKKVQLHSVAIGVHPRKKLHSSTIEIAILL